MNVALVGPGRWGRKLLRVLADLDGVTPVVVRRPGGSPFDGSPPARELGWEAMLADPEVTAAVVATPSRTHARLAARCLRAGKHVLVEKPLALSPGEAVAVERLAAERGLVLSTGHIFVHHLEFRALREALTGPPLEVTGHWRKDVPADRHLGWELLPHPVSIAAALFAGPPDLVDRTETPAGFGATLRWAAGGVARITAAPSPPNGWQVTVRGPGQAFAWSPAGLFRSGRTGAVRIETPPEEPLRTEVAAFLRAVRGRTGQADVVGASGVVAAVHAAVGPG